LTPWGLQRVIGGLRSRLDDVAGHLPQTDRRLDNAEGRLRAVDLRFDSGDERLERSLSEVRQRIDEQGARVQNVDDAIAGALSRLETVGAELNRLLDERTERVERRLDNVERIAGAAEGEAARLREKVIPAVVDRGNVLIDRLAEDLEELASLVQRMLQAEPLPLPSSEYQSRISEALAEVQPRVLEAFRGSEAEIRHRLEHHIEWLQNSPPVLDLGCGRGELLRLLREAGVESRGVESDPALGRAARQRGFDIIEMDAGKALKEQPDGRWGAIAAIHFLEHLPVSDLLDLLAEARRVLRPGGVLLAECPNPLSLRVGAALYWRDPTHQRPLLPETLRLYLEAGGFEVQRVDFLHPFPVEELFSVDPASPPESFDAGLAPLIGRLDRLASRLDELVNGPRDFAVIARKPSS